MGRGGMRMVGLLVIGSLVLLAVLVFVSCGSPPTKYRICFKSTTISGSGEWMDDRECAQAWVNALNIEWPLLHHWIEARKGHPDGALSIRRRRRTCQLYRLLNRGVAIWKGGRL